MQLNHRGQTLVLFVLLLPVLLLVLGFLVDIGNLHVQKRKIDYVVTDALEYGLEHKDDVTLKQDLYQFLLLNLKTVKHLEIDDTENLTILVTQKVNLLFPFLYSTNESEITIKKSISENKKIIKE